MTKFLLRPRAVEANKVVALGATPGYVQLDNGKVANIGYVEAAIGDWLVKDDSNPGTLMSPADFEAAFFQPADDITGEHLQSLIKEVDHITTGDLTICVLTLHDGRKVVANDNGLTGDKETREHLAYVNATGKLADLETYVLQGQLAMVGGSHD